MAIDFDVIKNAYGFTINTNGEVEGLVAGDMGYEGTGIVLDDESIEIWNMGVDAFVDKLGKDKNESQK